MYKARKLKEEKRKPSHRLSNIYTLLQRGRNRAGA